jgi:hypothetical protein
MNWRVMLCKKHTVEILSASFRIALAVVLVLTAYLGYRTYTAATQVCKLKSAYRASEVRRSDLAKEYQSTSARAELVSRDQLEAYAPATFAIILDQMCKGLGARIEQLETEDRERNAIDPFGGATVEGWSVLGHEIEIVTTYGGLQGILEGLAHLPMPFEITELDIARVGLGEHERGSLLRLSLKIEIYQPGGPAG